MSLTRGAAAFLAVLSFALVACGAPTTARSAPPITTTVIPAGPSARPTALSIPSIGVTSSLIETGTLPDNTPEVPPVDDPGQASWWNGTPAPGQLGPATLLGHVDGQLHGRNGFPGVFFRLRNLKPGAEIVVERAGAEPLVFVVDQVKVYAKVDFDEIDGQPSSATREVYGNTTRPELRLVTCGGDFDRSARSYRDQLIAFAHQKGT